jgi:hypothetical protein
MDSVQAELERLVELHNTVWTQPDTLYHYIGSNHNQALFRWLNEANPKADPKNALLYHRLMVLMLENTQMTKNGAQFPDPLALYMKSRIVNPEQTFFHGPSDRVLLHDIDLSQHGHLGANGARGSRQAFARSGYKTIIGHSHTPGIYKGCYQTGTSSLLQLEYNQGYSSWLHAHAIVYPNGKRTLIFIINGKWRVL